MNYEEAKLHREELNKICDTWGVKLNTFEKGEIGLTPDHIKALPEWKEIKRLYDNSFDELRKFNDYFVKTFKKEYAMERRNRRKQLSNK
jgi:hypothetical protein